MFLLDPILKRIPLMILAWTLSAHAQRLLIVASPLVPQSSISTKELSDIYIMKKQNWSDGIKIVPVNREVTSREREVFSKEVFHLSPQQMADYWNRLRFQGKLPPSVQPSDQAVLNFVRTIPGAIGYVSTRTLPKDVKVLMELQPEKP